MISDYFTEWLLLVSVFSLAVISPGPDFVMSVRNSVLYSRRTGLLTALGFGLGVLVHATYTVAGLAILISQSVLAFSIIKYIGAAYLLYIGIKSLRSKGFAGKVIGDNQESQMQREDLSLIAALMSGFITNVFNPKATLFFLALFTQIVGTDTPTSVKAVFGLTCFFMTVGWFSIVATILTDRSVRRYFISFSRWIDRLCGGLLIALGVRLAVSD